MLQGEQTNQKNTHIQGRKEGSRQARKQQSKIDGGKNKQESKKAIVRMTVTTKAKCKLKKSRNVHTKKRPAKPGSKMKEYMELRKNKTAECKKPT